MTAISMANFHNIDLYEYYGRRLQINHHALEKLWDNEEIRRTIALYMWSGLPLAAAIIYVTNECAGDDLMSDIHPQWWSFLKNVNRTRVQKKFNVVPIHGGHVGGDIVRQLARMVDYKLDGKILGFQRD